MDEASCGLHWKYTQIVTTNRNLVKGLHPSHIDVIHEARDMTA